MRVLIVGNPNTGKTTLYNCLTGATEKTANWTGVTVDARSRMATWKGGNIEFVDLPGLYSLQTMGEEERVAKNVIESEDSVILFVATIDSLERNLFLCHELSLLGKQIVLCVNTFGKNSSVDFSKFTKNTGIKVLSVDTKNCKEQVLSLLTMKDDSTQKYRKIFSYTQFLGLIGAGESQKLTKVDKFIFKKGFGVCLICALFCGVFWLAFGPFGSGLAHMVRQGVDFIGSFISEALSRRGWFILESFISSVFFDSVGSVLEFLPQLAILLTTIYILEDIGFLSRMAFYLHPILNRFGMSGRSIFSLFTGIGCTTSGVILARATEDVDIKKNTIGLLPFVGCAAKLPITLFLANLIFARGGVLVVVGLYIMTIMLGAIVCAVKKEESANEEGFIIEIPKLRAPSFKNVMLNIGKILIEFFQRVFVVVLLVSSVVWVLMSVNSTIHFELNSSQSLLYEILSKFEWLLSPLGFGSWKILFALVLGLLAKENIIVGLLMLDALSEISSIESMTSIIIFIFLYSPCLPALLSMRKEIGRGAGFRVFVFQTVFAWLSSWVFYTFAVYVGYWFGFLFLIAFALLFVLIKKEFSKSNKKTSIKCLGCVGCDCR